METKSVLIGIVIGALVGAGVGYGILVPQIGVFQSQIVSLQNQVNILTIESDKVQGFQQQLTTLTIEKTNLQSQISVLTIDKSNLQTQASNLQNLVNSFQNQISILTTEKSNLQSQINALTIEKSNLQIRVNDLQNQVESTKNQINVINKSNVDLQRKYDDLLFHYNFLNKSASNFTTIKDLNITLIIDHTIFYYKDSVTGNMTITYLNGSNFKGIFSVYIVPDFGGYGRSDYHGLQINGFTKFIIPAPVFRYGPGKYTIGIAGLSTIDDYIIASGVWIPSVQVEVK